MNIYQAIDKYLAYLKLNETEMSEEQFKEYALQVNSLRKKIAAYATQILLHFTLSGIIIPEDEAPVIKRRVYIKIQKVIDEETSKGELKRLGKILFLTYSLNSFLEAACDLRDKVIYQAYAPYWISKCEKKEVPDNWAGIKGTAWYSQIIDMFWHEECHIWVSATETAWCTCLPPTINRKGVHN